MPRGPGGVYAQPFPDVIPNTTIESSVYNGFVNDIEFDLNWPRPIVAGGTGGSSPIEAMNNLGGGTFVWGLEDGATLALDKSASGKSSEVRGTFNDELRWVLRLGDATAESGTQSGSNFGLLRYDDNGALIDEALAINRKTGVVKIMGRAAPDAALVINKTAQGQANSIQGQYNGVARWHMSLGDGQTESGSNSGSDFRLQAYSDTGSITYIPLSIKRDTGKVTVTGNPSPGDATFALNKPASGVNSAIRGETNTVARWQITLGDGAAETGTNVGSDFRINRYSDLGTVLGTPVSIQRNNGLVTIYNNANGALHEGALAINRDPAYVASIQGHRSGIRRWALILGDAATENGGNSGSDLRINAYADAGTLFGGVMFLERSSGNMFMSAQCFKPGGGGWADSSDARIKEVLGPYTSGLNAINALRPVRYKYLGNDVQHPNAPAAAKTKVPKRGQNPESGHYMVANQAREFIGLVAQEAEVPMPEMVTKTQAKIDGTPVNDYRVMDTTPLLFALVNAVQELAGRVSALEARRKP